MNRDRRGPAGVGNISVICRSRLGSVGDPGNSGKWIGLCGGDRTEGTERQSVAGLQLLPLRLRTPVRSHRDTCVGIRTLLQEPLVALQRKQSVSSCFSPASGTASVCGVSFSGADVDSWARNTGAENSPVAATRLAKNAVLKRRRYAHLQLPVSLITVEQRGAKTSAHCSKPHPGPQWQKGANRLTCGR